MIIIRQRWNTWHTARSDKHKMIRRQLSDHQRFDQVSIIWSSKVWSNVNCVSIKSLIRRQLSDHQRFDQMSIVGSSHELMIVVWPLYHLMTMSNLLRLKKVFQARGVMIWFQTMIILTIWRGAKMQLSKCRTEHLKHAPLIKAAIKSPKIIGRKYLLVRMMLLIIFIAEHCWQMKLLTVETICQSQATKSEKHKYRRFYTRPRHPRLDRPKNLNFSSAIRVFTFCSVLFCFVLILHIPGTFAVDFRLFHCKLQFEEFNYQSIADFMRSKWAAV